MSDDSHLKRMFDAQRKIDEGLATSFNDIHTMSLVSRDTSPGNAVHKSASLPVAIAVSMIALSAVIAFSIWNNAPQSDEPHAPSTTQTALQRLNQVCDSLLVTTREVDSVTNALPNQETEMEWPTGTDSLIRFETLSFNARTSP